MAAQVLRKLRSSPFGQAGVSSLEFALVTPAFLALLLGAMDFGLFFMTEHSLHTLVADTARTALIDSIQNDCTKVCASPVIGTQLTSLASTVPFIQTSHLILNVSQSKNSGVTTITVQATYPYSFFTPVLSSMVSISSISDKTMVSY